MGGQMSVSVDATPVPIEVATSKTGTSNTDTGIEASDAQKPSPGSSKLTVWKFTADNATCRVTCSPINVRGLTAFEPNACYLVLHIYRRGLPDDSPLTPRSNSGDLSEPGSARSSTYGDSSPRGVVVNELFASAKEQLTPRGVASAFSGWDSMSTGGGSSWFGHHIYVWNGKEAHATTKSTALTKALDMEKLFMEDYKSTLDSLFIRNGGVPLKAQTPSPRSLDASTSHLLRTLSGLAGGGKPSEGLWNTITAGLWNSPRAQLLDLSNLGSYGGRSTGAPPVAPLPIKTSPSPEPAPKRSPTPPQANDNKPVRSLPLPSVAIDEATVDAALEQPADAPPPRPNLSLKSIPSDSSQPEVGSASSAASATASASASDKPSPSGGKVAVPTLSLKSVPPTEGAAPAVTGPPAIPGLALQQVPPTEGSGAASSPSPMKLDLSPAKSPTTTTTSARDDDVTMAGTTGDTDSGAESSRDGGSARSATSGYKRPPEFTPDFTLTEKDQKQRKLAHFDKVISTLRDYLAVGSRTMSQNKEALRAEGITHVLNSASSVCESPFKDTFEYLIYNLYDAGSENISLIFYNAVRFIDRVRESNGKVFVHCHQGVSRSVTLCCMYMILRENRDFEDVFQEVKKLRGVASPNAGFIFQLLEFRKKLVNPLRGRRLYRLACLYKDHDPSVIVAKPTGSDDLSVAHLDPRLCFVLHCRSGLFVWQGREASDTSVHAAEQLVTDITEFETSAKDAVVTWVQQGEEPESFWSEFATRDSKGDAVDVKSGVAYNSDYDKEVPGGESTGAMTSRRPATTTPSLPIAGKSDSQAPPMTSRRPAAAGETANPTNGTGRSGDEKEEPQLFTWPDMEALTVFDSDDLDPDQVLILVSNDFEPENTLYVWLGMDADVAEGDGEGIAREFLDKQKGTFGHRDMSVSVVLDGDESDEFWDLFVNG